MFNWVRKSDLEIMNFEIHKALRITNLDEADSNCWIVLSDNTVIGIFQPQ